MPSAYVILQHDNQSALAELYGQGVIGMWNGIVCDSWMLVGVRTTSGRSIVQLKTVPGFLVLPEASPAVSLDPSFLSSLPEPILTAATTAKVVTGLDLARVVKQLYGGLSGSIYPDLM